MESATVILTALSVIASIFFNLLLYKASKKSAEAAEKSAVSADKSALVAEETLKFTKEQQVRLDKETELMSKVYQARWRDEANYILAILGGIKAGDPNPLAIQKGYNIVVPTPYELGRYFTLEQTDAIPKIKEIFIKHYSNFWMDNVTGGVSMDRFKKKSERRNVRC